MRAELAERIERAVGAPVRATAPVGGGDINEAFRVDLGDGRRVFVKANSSAPARMFEAEAHGLGWLAEADAVRVPRVIAVGDDHLVLEWLERGQRRRGFDEALGRGLARLHRIGAPRIGLERDNFVGTVDQCNDPAPSWTEFWIARRIEPMVVRAIERRGAPARWRDAVDRLAGRMATVGGPAEPTARLHGDLWHGNVHAAGFEPALIDPAVYGGHREVDLAMLALFGGLSDALVGGYQEVWPLAAGWRERLALWQTYPLLVHVVLFGGGYAGAVEAAFERFA